MKEFAESLHGDQRAELFGLLIDLADEADPSDTGAAIVAEAFQRRSEVESGEVKLLSGEEFWDGLR